MSRLSSAQANQVDADVASRAGVNICRGQHVVTVSGTEDALRRADNASCEVGVVLIGHGLGPSAEGNSCLMATTLNNPYPAGCAIYHIAANVGFTPMCGRHPVGKGL